MRVLYFDLLCGAAGDMLLASLIDLGFPVNILEEQLKKLPVEKIALKVDKVMRSSIACTSLVPQLGHAHEHRHLHGILDILRNGNVEPHVYEQCEKVLDRLAEAEASIHGIAKEKVHFHEIGALDTIVDILGVCMAMEYFKADDVYFSTLTDGHGTVRTAHGTIPVPVPATAMMIRGLTLKTLDLSTELLTPTGAALLTTLGTQRKTAPEGDITAIGYGCGTKVFDTHPNFIRVSLIDQGGDEAVDRETIAVLESDMDHVSGEIMGDVTTRLFSAGALDVCYLPVYMKKGRPGYRLSVITKNAHVEPLVDCIVRHTRTLGVRIYRVDRIIARRTASNSTLGGEECAEKECIYKDYRFIKPEYEALAKIADKRGCSVLDLMEEYLREHT
jgi:pyridinium-3,5-bisthiocarboxylic acid mononucleotide nickel chelatase